jgi:hypothetical protein
MRRKSFRGAWLLVAWLAFVPAAAWGQFVDLPPLGSTPPPIWPVPELSWGRSADARPQAPVSQTVLPAPAVVRGQSADVQLGYAPPGSPSLVAPLPLGSTRPEDGGLFVAAQALYFTQTVPLKSQVVGVYGFRDRDGSITGVVDQFVGSGAPALNVNQLTGQDTYTIGTEIDIGWKFANGSSVAVNWMFLGETHYRAAATLSPKAGILDPSLANSFLYADVYNIPPQYSGTDFKIKFPITQAGFVRGQPTAQAAFGIWNAAEIMTIDFIQRFQRYEIIYREPIFETETYRLNGLVGPRYTWIWERFAWRTTSAEGHDILNQTIIPGPSDVGVYTNIVSNRMYGAVAGCEQEYYLGHGIVFQLKLQGALYVDTAKVIAKYETADRFNSLPENKLAKRLWSIVPEVDANIGLMWYPAEFVQMYAGYQAMGILNTVSSRVPINFNYGNPDPHWSGTSRFLGGLTAGIAFTF